jgi:hypothetical protein
MIVILSSAANAIVGSSDTTITSVSSSANSFPVRFSFICFSSCELKFGKWGRFFFPAFSV